MRWWQFGKRDADLERELISDLELEEEEQRERGLSPEEAYYAARRALGNTTLIREQTREAWGWSQLDHFIRDVRYALRQLRMSPGFSVTTILILAIGISATTAIFSLVNAVLLRPLPFPESDRLVWASQQDNSLPGITPESLSYPDYLDWRAQNHTLSGIASYVDSGITFELEGGSQRLDGQTVSANFFDVLGVAPMLGRDFQWDDEKPGNRVVMLSFSFWQSQFGSANDIVGKSITLDGHDYTIAGVMPKGFRFPFENPAPVLWKSLAEESEGKNPPIGQRGFDHLDVIGRLKPDVTIEQAKADLSLIAGNLAVQYPDNNKQYNSALIEPELKHMTGDTGPALRIFLGAVLLVLLIVCANVAGLLLARGSRRSREFALRAALGASRGDIIRQVIVESVILSLCGGAAGAALAAGLVHVIVNFMPLEIPRIQEATISPGVLLFVITVSLITGLLFGLVPAWRISHATPADALREGSRSVSGAKGQHLIHNILVIAQTAIGMVLLISSGLLMRSFIRILNVDPGFDPKHVFTSRIGVSFDNLTHDQHFRFYEQLLARISALPGVQSAAAGWPLPMSSSHISVSFNIAGRPVAPGDEPSVSTGVVMPGYFETMHIPLLSGRDFGQQDSLTGQPAIIVNQAFVRKYFPLENPIGQHIQVGLGDGVFEHPTREVVGVVGDVKGKGLAAESEPHLYLAYAQAVITNPYIVVRTNADTGAIQNAITSTVHELDRTVPVYQAATMEEYISKSEAQPRFQALLLTYFAGIGLILVAIGLYGLLSYIVVQRTPEIGVRMALGAQRFGVLGMIVRRGLVLTVTGVAAGLVISVMTTRLIAQMLFHVRATDPLTFAITAVLLLVVSIAASSVPAYRAARVDPINTLRGQ